jgi:hypothetical protein
MVFEKPLIDSRELLRAIDPVRGRNSAAVRSLTQRQLISPGIDLREVVRQPLLLYCSLNRDAVSAVRSGHQEVAREIRDHAERIEQGVLAPWLMSAAESALDHRDEDDEHTGSQDVSSSWVDRLLIRRQVDRLEPFPAVVEAAREVAEIRAVYADDALEVQVIVGHVWRVGDDLAEVRTTAGPAAAFALPTAELFDAGLRLGDPVVLRHEALAPGTILTTYERGIETDARINRLSGQSLPRHLDQLLDGSPLSAQRLTIDRPIKRLA